MDRRTFEQVLFLDVLFQVRNEMKKGRRIAMTAQRCTLYFIERNSAETTCINYTMGAFDAIKENIPCLATASKSVSRLEW
jgi:hypothetical protein